MIRHAGHAITRRCGRLLAALLLITPLLVHAGAASAQDSQRIAAVVNDEIISVRDLHNAMRLAVVLARLPDNQETYRRIRGQVLWSLIDETLHLQEARRLSIGATEEEFARAAGVLEQRLGIRRGTFFDFLAANGISRATARRQVRASIVWSRLVRLRFGQVATVADEEIDEVLDLYRRSLGQPQYLVSEILLSSDDPDGEARIRDLATRIHQRLTQPGSDFRAIARQFSASASSAQGGLIGWVTAGQLAPEIEAALAALSPGDVAPPLRTDLGYHIVKLEERRILKAADPLKARVTLAYLTVIPPDSETGNDLNERIRALEVETADARTCADIGGLAGARPDASAGELGPVQVGELAPALREIVEHLEPGVPSRPVALQAGMSVFMVCERTAAPDDTPSREDVMARLVTEKLRTLARRYRRDLRRDAFIDTRR